MNYSSCRNLCLQTSTKWLCHFQIFPVLFLCVCGLEGGWEWLGSLESLEFHSIVLRKLPYWKAPSPTSFSVATVTTHFMTLTIQVFEYHMALPSFLAHHFLEDFKSCSSLLKIKLLFFPIILQNDGMLRSGAWSRKFKGIRLSCVLR